MERIHKIQRSSQITGCLEGTKPYRKEVHLDKASSRHNIPDGKIEQIEILKFNSKISKDHRPVRMRITLDLKQKL